MRIKISPDLRKFITLPDEIDTSTMTADDIEALDEELDLLRETGFENVDVQDRPAFQWMITDVTVQLTTALVNQDHKPADPVVVLTAPAPRAPSSPEKSPLPSSMPSASTASPGTSVARRPNPHKGKVKNLRGDFGGPIHDQFHFAPTDAKSYHGVWGTSQIGTIKKWVGQALDSIYLDDDYLVASKKGRKPGEFNYLVNMDTEVGYLSGSKMKGKTPPATHIEVFLNKSGVTVSAFPSDPANF